MPRTSYRCVASSSPSYLSAARINLYDTVTTSTIGGTLEIEMSRLGRDKAPKPNEERAGIGRTAYLPLATVPSDGKIAR